jgi:hypothetical protein
MHATHAPHTALRHVCLASALLLTSLCALTLATGVSQQWFEWVRPPAAYATRLVRDAQALRAIIALDDVFIAAYVASAVLFVRFLSEPAREPLHAVAVGFSVAAGVLDLAENHHLLSLLTLAEAGLPVPVEDILLRSQLSQLKWMLGHVAFAFLGLTLTTEAPLVRQLRIALVYVQLPLGAITWAAPFGPWLPALVWLRYGALISGFAAVAWLASRPLHPVIPPRPASPVADAAAGSGAPV